MFHDTYVKYIRFNVFMVRIYESNIKSGEGKKSSRGEIAQHKYTLNGVTAV